MVCVMTRDRTHTVRAQKLVLVEHLRKNAAKPLFVHDRHQPPAIDAKLSWIMNRGD